MVQRIPAWSTNLSKRVVSRLKVALLDTGLAARLVNITATGASPVGNPALAGPLLEGFVAGQLRRQLTWSQDDARLHNYRDHDIAEVDLLLQSVDGRVADIGVKSTASVTVADTRRLARLRDGLDQRCVAGVVLHTGPTAAPFGERISAVPIDALWAA